MSDQADKHQTSSSAEKINGFQRENTTEIQIPVPWGHISETMCLENFLESYRSCHRIKGEITCHLPTGKWWGPKDIQPIVALHGRQDNAGSFDTLIPLLPDDVSVLCLDMPGHGLSSHYPKSQFYYVYWDGVMLLRRIVKHYQWNKVKLMGHSLGGAISFLYAASYPKEVEFYICLDIASPSVRDVTKTASLTGGLVDKFLKYESLLTDNAPCYNYEEMLQIVEDAYNGSITRKSAEILMKRGMQPAFEPDRYYFSRDPRLKVSLLGMLSMDLVLAYAAEIKCAYLNIRAVPGMKFDQPENYEIVLDKIKESSRKFEYREVEGTHHVHLNNPERVAPVIKEFIDSYRDTQVS